MEQICPETNFLNKQFFSYTSTLCHLIHTSTNYELIIGCVHYLIDRNYNCPTFIENTYACTLQTTIK